MTVTQNPAVVFAYHDVGVRGLSALLACGVNVKLVVTHEDNPQENIWFGSVQRLAQLNGIPVITPADPNVPEVLEAVRRAAPDWLFSFYYRHMLSTDLLEIPPRGAFNLHGSLLPRYRGRVPVNWAIIHGETETGVSLHRMEKKPDAGNLLAQDRIPILPNDTALDVFRKMTVAAETLLLRTVPDLLEGHAKEVPLNLSEGSYFGGRKPEDGRIDWSHSAQTLHNLIRAVAAPYPGAFFDYEGKRIQIMGSYYRGLDALGPQPRLYWLEGDCWADCQDGKRLCLTQLVYENAPLTEVRFKDLFSPELILNTQTQ